MRRATLHAFAQLGVRRYGAPPLISDVAAGEGNRQSAAGLRAISATSSSRYNSLPHGVVLDRVYIDVEQAHIEGGARMMKVMRKVMRKVLIFI